MQRAVELLGCLAQSDVLKQQGQHHLFFCSVGSSGARIMHPPFGIDAGLGPMSGSARAGSRRGQGRPRSGTTLSCGSLCGQAHAPGETPRPGVPTLNTLNQVPQELASTSPDATCELPPVTTFRNLQKVSRSITNFLHPPPARQPGDSSRPDLWSRSRTDLNALRVARTF